MDEVACRSEHTIACDVFKTSVLSVSLRTVLILRYKVQQYMIITSPHGPPIRAYGPPITAPLCFLLWAAPPDTFASLDSTTQIR